ncbi:hypothetical protein SAMN05421831_11351 [Allopseudospirillum japonicum]|uniref:DUF416 family protein n=1 Tax=Allopseudospirillum japonicum TaxID=64971 RepID=A0A1H6U8M4_9GAMM|nr:YjaG family protein [Allopseudospirillum japonicum]SEI85967.1 hypothetical protein SAMN05421831_11351 [Allopseudospirillum japonicum]
MTQSKTKKTTLPKPPSFNQSLRLLAPWQQVAFAACLSQRMLPNYLLFAENLAQLLPENYSPQQAQGACEQAQQLMDLIWQVQLHPQTRINIEAQQEKLEALMPDPQSFTCYGVYPALDALMGLSTTLGLLEQADADEVVRMSRLSRACVYQLLEMEFTSVSELDPQSDAGQQALKTWIRQQDLMQEEEAFQDEVLAQLQACQQASKAFYRRLRTLGENQGISNLGISLAD